MKKTCILVALLIMSLSILTATYNAPEVDITGVGDSGEWTNEGPVPAENVPDAWDPTVEYEENDLVRYNGIVWKSAGDNNEGNAPGAVVITYNLNHIADGDVFDVELYISADDGETWDFPYTNSFVEGIGEITAEENNPTGLEIVWDVVGNHPNLWGDEFLFRILIDDGFVDASPDYVYVPAGNFNKGADAQDTDLNTNYMIMKYDVTNAEFLAFLNDIWDPTDPIIEIHVDDDNSFVRLISDGTVYYHLGEPTNDHYGRINFTDDDPNFFEIIGGFGEDANPTTDFDNHPVTFVTKEGAEAYAAWLGYGWELPSGDEWEKAARGPFVTPTDPADNLQFPWDDDPGNPFVGDLHDYVNILGRFEDDSDDPVFGTTEVGFFDGSGTLGDNSSPYGVYDMAGNVWNWTTQFNDPLFVVRGGSGNTDAENNEEELYVYYIGEEKETGTGFQDVGFRLVRKQGYGVSSTGFEIDRLIEPTNLGFYTNPYGDYDLEYINYERKVVLSWEGEIVPNDNFEKINIYRKEDAGDYDYESPLHTITDGTVTTWTDQLNWDDDNGKHYRYKVVVYYDSEEDTDTDYAGYDFEKDVEIGEVDLGDELDFYYFKPAWYGTYGYQHMNFYIYESFIGGDPFEAGDEIAVFDDGLCVGAVRVPAGFDPATDYPLVINASADLDARTNVGFDDGEEITFKVYHSGHADEDYENWEYTSDDINMSYTYEGPEDAAGKPIFEMQANAFVNFDIIPFERQVIDLREGWNIISFRVIPTEYEMIDIFDDLIQANVLTKVMDQAGDALVKLTQAWTDNIGEMKTTQGYRVRVTEDTQLVLIGIPIQPESTRTPNLLTIPFSSTDEDWYLISYPYEVGLEVLQDNDTDPGVFYQNIYQWTSEHGFGAALDDTNLHDYLIKVQDQAGNALIYVDTAGRTLVWTGWIDHIEEFGVNQGYAVKVAGKGRLIYRDLDSRDLDSTDLIPPSPPVPEETFVEYQDLPNNRVSDRYFETVWSGYGWNHFNVFVDVDDFLSSQLTPGDELAIFDGDICVGSAIYTGEDRFISIAASLNDNMTSYLDGYLPGNTYSLNVWLAEEGYEITGVEFNVIYGSEVFDISGEAILRIPQTLSTDEIGVVTPEATELRAIFPNPFNPDTNIQYSVAQPGNVTIEVFNVRGQRVKTLVSEYQEAGIYQINWNGKDSYNNSVSSGLYFTRMISEESTQTRKMMLVK